MTKQKIDYKNFEVTIFHNTNTIPHPITNVSIRHKSMGIWAWKGIKTSSWEKQYKGDIEKFLPKMFKREISLRLKAKQRLKEKINKLKLEIKDSEKEIKEIEKHIKIENIKSNETKAQMAQGSPIEQC